MSLTQVQVTLDGRVLVLERGNRVECLTPEDTARALGAQTDVLAELNARVDFQRAVIAALEEAGRQQRALLDQVYNAQPGLQGV